MIKGLHAMFFTPQAEELRAFMRDQLQLPFTDTGDGWFIFDLKEVEIGCHPADQSFQGMSFYCDDLAATVAQLKQRGVEFTSDVREAEWGWVTTFRIPGNFEVELYQAKYEKKPIT